MHPLAPLTSYSQDVGCTNKWHVKLADTVGNAPVWFLLTIAVEVAMMKLCPLCTWGTEAANTHYTHSYSHTDTQHIHTDRNAHTQTHTHARMHARTHAHTHTHPCAQSHTHLMVDWVCWYQSTVPVQNEGDSLHNRTEHSSTYVESEMMR